MSTVKKRGLGRGLASLLSEVAPVVQAPPTVVIPSHSDSSTKSALQTLPVDLLQRGKYQPRKTMDEQSLQELAASIKHAGIIQPLVVRQVSVGRYEIVAGERRWRAAQLAGLHEVPVVVREINDHEASALALIENIQREELNAFEEAQALQRLINEFSLTHEELAQSLGKSRATITNLLRVLNLNADVQRLLASNQIELGHAKVLLGLSGQQQSQAAQQVVARGLSVRETEQYIRQLQQIGLAPKADKSAVSADIRTLQDRLSGVLGAKVTFSHHANGKGKMIIDYDDLNQLDGILARIEST